MSLMVGNQVNLPLFGERRRDKGRSKMDSPTNHPFEDFEVISTYSRKEAIEDGVLVDVSGHAKELGFNYPVALTQAAWVQFVQVPEGLEAEQDESGRLRDVLWMLLNAIKRSKNGGPEVYFSLYLKNNHSKSKHEILKSICHAGDGGEAVITIMLPNED